MSLSPYITCFTVAEVVCLLAALYFLRGEPGRGWQGHGVYILLGLLTDLFGTYIAVSHPDDALANHWLHNAFMCVEGLFVPAMLFERIRELRKCSRVILYIWWGLFLMACWRESAGQKNEPVFLAHSYWLLCAVLIAGCFCYLLMLLTKPEEDEKSLPAAFFWVLGTLFFYAGVPVYLGFFKRLAVLPPIFGYSPDQMLWDAININLCALWTYSFYRLSGKQMIRASIF